MTDLRSKMRPVSKPDQNPACLVAFLALFHRGSVSADRGAEPMPYHLRDDFLSDAEASSFRVLRGLMGARWPGSPPAGSRAPRFLVLDSKDQTMV